MSVLAGARATTTGRDARLRRKSALALSASAATLAALVSTGPAWAATTVSGGSTAVATSTAASGSADDIVQTGTLSVTSGAAITLDSDNSVTNSGTIQLKDVSDVTGVLAQAGHTGTITNSGAISISESATTTTTTSTGVVTGPFATGSNRYGVRVTGAGTLTGDIINTGTISVQGEDSAGISLESALSGSITSSGAIAVAGSRSYGIHTTGAVGGAVTLASSVSASGEGAQAVAIGGDVGGGLIVESTVTSTGYHTASRSTTASVLADQNASDIAQGGPAISVAGSLGGGLLISAPPSTLSSTVTDVNGDGIADASETTGSVISYGSASAIQLGAVGRDISLGDVGTGDSAYGVVIGGTVSGQGLRDGISAAGLQIGVDGGGAVTISHGVHVSGTLSAVAYGGDASTLHLYSGANVASLYNTGVISAAMTGEGAQSAQAIVIEAGASLPVIQNAATINAVVVGSTGDAAAIVDKSGTLVRLENIGTINAQTAAASGSTTTPTGSTVAIDVSANTTGFSLLNYLPSGATTAATINGSVLMGSGNDSVDMEAGSLTGDLAFGAGANTLTIAGGATVAGGLTADGGTLALSVDDGSLTITSTSFVNLTSLNLGAGSSVVFTADPASGSATQFDVAGAATIASGAKIDVRLASFATGAASYTLIRADQLTASGVDGSLLGSSPYIYSASISTDAAAGTVSLDLARKTASELALPAALSGGYEPVIAAASANAGLSAAVLAQTDRASFISVYNQLLPEHSGGVFRMVSAGVESFGRPLDERQGGGDGGGWLQEVNYAALADDKGDMLGYRSWGVGLVGGYELPATRAGVFGVSLGVLSTQMRPHETSASTQVSTNLVDAGGYWRASYGRFSANARLGLDYLNATSRRAVDLISDDQTLFSETASGHWSGWGVTSRMRVAYEGSWRNLYLRPQVGLDYLKLREGGYQEGGSDALDLKVESRDTSELTSFAGITLGAIIGDDASFWSPELLIGYRNVLSRSGGSTTAAFSSGETFTVGPVDYGDQGLVARFALKSESGPTAFSFEGGAERRDGLTVFDAKIAGHFSF
ncbi:autotransporter domain-containing protein [Phenylobacterium sp. LjRoot225]|uniref:autotransporter outer membrane beta-barrel domain-containing protein n=1 Tax=Phenylobacterium sp. LjRoot225 TaxID=3342285 RepID=UPI003ECF7E42